MRQPGSYTLALAQRPSLHARYEDIRAAVSGDGAFARLEAFGKLLQDGRAAINMTIAGCVRMLDTGHWLNAHEVVALAIPKKRSRTCRERLRQKLGRWYGPRLAIEKILRFRHDTHYAALNLGGCGPDYGECCVRLEKSSPYRFSTCFAGDTIRTVFNAQGMRQLTNAEILSRFATRKDVVRLAAIHNPDILTRPGVLDREDLVRLLDNRESLVEVHIHGPITRDHIHTVSMRKAEYTSLAHRAIEYERLSIERHRRPERFDKVRAYIRLLQLADFYKVRLVTE